MDHHSITTVLHLCEHFGGAKASLHGVAKSFLWILPCLVTTNCRMLLCSRKGPDRAAEQMQRGGLHPLYLGYGKMDPRNLIELIRLVRREKVDIIHAHGLGACAWARLAGLLLHIPVIVHGRANYGTVPLVMRPIEWLLGPITKHAFAVSESTRQFMIHKRHIRPDVVKVLYNGILLDHIAKADPRWITKFRAAHGADAGHMVLGVVGRLMPHKGHLEAFQAAREVARTYPKLVLWVIGDGEFMPTLQRWVTDHKCEGLIRFLGFRSDVLDVIQCLDAQVFPSHMEGTPNTLFEAMAVGNVIIATPTDGQGEILNDGATALIFPVGDSRALARCIVRLYESPDLALRLRRHAQQRSMDFDGRKCVQVLQQTYAQIMAER